jgi:hypothetical protein
MAISDIYTGRVSGTAVTVSTANPILSLLAAGTAGTAFLKRLYVVGIRVDIVTTTAVAGNNVLFQLARNTAGASTASNLVSGNAHDFSAPASLGQVATSWTSAAPAVGTVLWEQELPQTTGSSWEEFPPAGYEWQVPAIANQTANAGLHVFVTQSATTSTTYNVDLIWSE